jgi:hypothetical protein
MKFTLQNFILLSLLALLNACGGGGSFDSNLTGGGSSSSGGTESEPMPGTRIVSAGIMIKGSVVVNGVRFDDSGADISIDGTPKTATDLQDGMVVQVEGRVGADSVATAGNALRVDAQVQVRGSVTSVDSTTNPQSFVVLGQDVLVDDLTIYSGVTGFADVAPDDLVEVHGLRDTLERVHATRIEANPAQMGDSTFDQIRGVVTGGAGTNPATFNLGAQAVNAAGAVITPVGATYENSTLIEVRCNVRPCVDINDVFQASRLEVEREEDSDFQPESGERFEAEGYISGFDSASDQNFFVSGVPVTTTGSTFYKGGIEADLGNDVRVEAEGIWKYSALIANKIQFKRIVVRLQGEPSTPSEDTFTLQIADIGAVIIETTDLTEGTLPDGTESCVQVRGQRKAVEGQIVTADEIDPSCSDSERPLIQAQVEDENPEVSLTLLGFTINVSDPTGLPPWSDVDGESLSRTEFFDAVSAPTINPANVLVPGTLVKVTFDELTDFLSQASIED